MIKCNYLILSEWINLDQITGLASIYNILEKFSNPDFPFTIGKIAMLAFFERTSRDFSKFEIEWKIFNNDELIKSEEFMLDFNDKFKHKWINIFQWIDIKEPWELRFSIYSSGKEINRYIIELEKN